MKGAKNAVTQAGAIFAGNKWGTETVTSAAEPGDARK